MPHNRFHQPAQTQSQRPNTQTPEHPTNPMNPMNPMHLIPWEQIIPNPNQPRRRFDLAALQELADSIQQHGILQPLLVRQTGLERFEIIAGERRHRAAKMAGLTAVPAIVQKLTDQEQTEVALIENLQREDLSPVETARAFRTLMTRFGLTQQELSQRTGKSQSAISRTIRLLELPDDILDALERGDILERHTRALLTIRQQVIREGICQQVLKEKLSAQETERRIRAVIPGTTALNPPNIDHPFPGKDPFPLNKSDTNALTLQLESHFSPPCAGRTLSHENSLRAPYCLVSGGHKGR
jgi:ParB family transcriptional regulator, chromosome partitioning protein